MRNGREIRKRRGYKDGLRKRKKERKEGEWEKDVK